MSRRASSRAATMPANRSYDDQQIERAALAAWREMFGYECREPLREKGGALDPRSYCMKLAVALARDRPLPHLYKDTPTRRDSDWVEAALDELEAVGR